MPPQCGRLRRPPSDSLLTNRDKSTKFFASLATRGNIELFPKVLRVQEFGRAYTAERPSEPIGGLSRGMKPQLKLRPSVARGRKIQTPLCRCRRCCKWPRTERPRAVDRDPSAFRRSSARSWRRCCIRTIQNRTRVRYAPGGVTARTSMSREGLAMPTNRPATDANSNERGGGKADQADKRRADTGDTPGRQQLRWHDGWCATPARRRPARQARSSAEERSTPHWRLSLDVS